MENLTLKTNLAELHAELKKEFHQLVANAQSLYQDDKKEWIDTFENWLDSFDSIEEGEILLHQALVYFMMQRTQVGWSNEQKIQLLTKSVQYIDQYKQTHNIDNSNELIIGETPRWRLTPSTLTECMVYEWLAEVYHRDDIKQTILWTERALQIMENVYGRASQEFAKCLKRAPLTGIDYVDFVEKWAANTYRVREYGLVWLSAADNVFLSLADSQETNILKTKQKIQYMERALSIDPDLSCKGTLAKLKECLKEVECGSLSHKEK